jgi:hypothetical protein
MTAKRLRMEITVRFIWGQQPGKPEARNSKPEQKRGKG